MTRPKPHRTDPGSADSERIPRCVAQPTTNGLLVPDELNRWADLVANTEVAFPEGLTAVDRARLLEDVRRRRRSRLVQFIARAIAQDILRTRGQ